MIARLMTSGLFIMYFITKELFFPPAEMADDHGILAVGGDLAPERLILAYRNGIFPWFEDDDPILWWSPDPRMAVFPATYKAPRSVRQVVAKNLFTVTFNTAFEDVVKNCQKITRKGQVGTWINDDLAQSFFELHQRGMAQSVEVWQEGELVGGLYGMDLGHVFCGESMFSKVSNASKYAFVALIDFLKQREYKLLDCQLHNPYLESLGATQLSRKEFLKILAK
jgi:leucyl/phenylalanyl-tRNA---protein transferase